MPSLVCVAVYQMLAFSPPRFMWSGLILETDQWKTVFVPPSGLNLLVILTGMLQTIEVLRHLTGAVVWEKKVYLRTQSGKTFNVHHVAALGFSFGSYFYQKQIHCISCLATELSYSVPVSCRTFFFHWQKHLIRPQNMFSLSFVCCFCAKVE